MSTSTASSTDTSRKSQALNRQIVFWAITSALAGFLFGFDTVVISGAEQKIQALWGLSSGVHGFAIASALYGTVLGSLFGGWPTDHFGRKKTLVCIGVLYVISAVGSAFANGIAMFIVARVIGGIGIGISTVAAPLYISEIAPPAYRGRLAGTFQFKGGKTGLPGLPDSQEDVGGWEQYPEERRPADWDTDHDGMPDEWERRTGLNPSDASDGNRDHNSDGYTNLEKYLNSLVGEYSLTPSKLPNLNP